MSKTETQPKSSKPQEDGTEEALAENGFSVIDTDKMNNKNAEAENGGIENTDSGNEEKKSSEDNKMEVDATKISQDSTGDDKEKGDEVEKNEGEQGTESEPVKEGSGDSEAQSENKESDKNEDKQAEPENKKPRHPVVWVSNISRHIKATDLKKHFSQHGKVVTAKIVTNGKNFFGYVCLDSLEAVDVCIKKLNDSEFEGRKITVSVDKPDRDERIKLRNSTRQENTAAPNSTRDPLTTVYDEEAKQKAEENESRKRKLSSERRHSISSSSSRKKVDASKMSEEELRKEVSNCEREIDRLRNRLLEEQARCRAEIKRCRRLERELSDAETKIREDRKKFEREREDLVKKNRLEHLRMDADRVMVDRERQELLRQREEFERDLRRFVDEQQRMTMDRRAPSPPIISKRFRGDDAPSEPKGATPWADRGERSPGAQGPDRGGRASSFFQGNQWGPQGGSNSSQWRSQGPPQPFFRNDGYRGSQPFSKGPGGFRSGPFDSSSTNPF